MGKSFVGVRDTVRSDRVDYVLGEVYSRLRRLEVVEASQPAFFRRSLLPLGGVRDVLIGVDGTGESIVYFWDGNFVVFGGVVRVKTIMRLAFGRLGGDS